MLEFIEMCNLFKLLMQNFTFGLTWFLLGVIIVLIVFLASNPSPKLHEKATGIKAIGLTIGIFFILPGIVTLFYSVTKFLNV